MTSEPAQPAIVAQRDPRVEPRFAGLRTFARLPRIEDVERVDLAVLGVPCDSGGTFRPGARFAPAAIREASMLLRGHNEALGVSPFETIQVADAGDSPASPVDLVAAHDTIERDADELHAAGGAVLGLGGDHSISLPLLRAAAVRHGPLSLVHFDAHTDTNDILYGSSLSHGTPFRRALESNLIDPTTSVQIGLHGSVFSDGALKENAELGFKFMLAREFDEVGVRGAVELIRTVVRQPIYLTIDVDVLDIAVAPGTSTPEVGGLSSREMLATLQGFREFAPDIVAADVVEVAPPYDPSGATAFVAANLTFEIVSLIASQRAEASQRWPRGT